jgi:hypothetical protein
MSKQEIVYTIKDVVDAINGLQDINLDPKNDFGNTVGDELNEIKFHLKELVEIQTRQAVAMEKIYTRMRIQE